MTREGLPSRKDAISAGRANMKPKNNSPIAKRNRNNRSRGSHFEKVVADYLDMDVVPYSGSNARFGYGDVRDSKWLGECKNITSDDGRYCIKQEWINDNRTKASGYGLMPYLAWMPSGRSEKFIILEKDIFSLLGVGHNITVEIPKKAITAVNLFIDINDNWMKPVRTGKHIARLIFGDLELFMMEISTFKYLIGNRGLKGSKTVYDNSTG